MRPYKEMFSEVCLPCSCAGSWQPGGGARSSSALMDLSESHLYLTPLPPPPKLCLVLPKAFIILVLELRLQHQELLICGPLPIKRQDVKVWFCSPYLAVCKMRLRRDFFFAPELRGSLFKPKAVWNSLHTKSILMGCEHICHNLTGDFLFHRCILHMKFA